MNDFKGVVNSVNMHRFAEISVGQLNTKGKTNVKAINNLRISFNLSLSNDRDANKGSITLYNASDSTLRELGIDTQGSLQQPLAIQLNAGYLGVSEDTGSIGTLFTGIVYSYASKLKNGVRSTKFKAVDGVINAATYPFVESYKKGCLLTDVVQDIVDTMYDFMGNDYMTEQSPAASKVLNNVKLENGLALSCSCGDALSFLGDSYGFTWTIRGEIVYLIGFKDTNDSIQEAFIDIETDPYLAPLIVPETGLLGDISPYYKKNSVNRLKSGAKGIVFTCLLNPLIKPGYPITVGYNRDHKEAFLVTNVKVKGDTHRPQQWTMEVTAINEWF